MTKRRGKLAYIREILYSYYNLLNSENLTENEKKRIIIVENVINDIKDKKHSDDILSLMYFVYHDKYNLSDIAYKLLISERSAYRYNRIIMDLMDKHLNLI